MAKTKKTEKPVIKYSQHDRIFAALEILQQNCLERTTNSQQICNACADCPIAVKYETDGKINAICIFDLVGIAPSEWDIQPNSFEEPLLTDSTYDWF